MWERDIGWDIGTGEPAVFTVERSYEDEDKGAFDCFAGIAIDGDEADSSLYTAEAGSVILTFGPDYLETLGAGEHTLTATFEDGSADALFTVEMPEDTPAPANDTKPADATPANGPANGTPKSGDESQTAWTALVPIAMLALAGGAALRKRELCRF